MMRIPTDGSNGDVVLELDDETNVVRLIFELEPKELTGSRRERPEIEAILSDKFLGGVEARPVTKEEGLALLAEVLDLRTRFEQLERERDVYRALLPSEAREIAAALRHYAKEAEAR